MQKPNKFGPHKEANKGKFRELIHNIMKKENTTKIDRLLLDCME